MFKRILIPVDGSPLSNRALATGLRLAKEQRAKVRVIHVADVTPPANVEPMYIDFDAYRATMLSSGRDIIRSAERRLRASRVPAEAQLLETVTHDLSGAILQVAARWRADLIVIGTHGRTGLARLFLGSVAEGVVRHATSAVMLIRGERQPGRARRPATTRRTKRA